MRTLSFLAIVAVVVLFGQNTYAQSFMYEAIQDRLSAEQTTEIGEAQGYADKAQKSTEKAEAIEKEYAKLKGTGKKSKDKKYEKKIWEAKKHNIDAEVKYAKAYTAATTVYSAFLNEAAFYLDSDKEEALRLDSEAMELMGNADNNLSKIKKDAGDKKDLGKMSSSKLSSELASSHKLMEDALEKQFRALELYTKQADKKKYDENDRRAWDEAQTINTIEGYQDYIANFSRGKYVAEARERMGKLKEAPVVDEPDDNVNHPVANAKGYVFKVQIAASRKPLSHERLAEIYPQVDKIERQFIGGKYKYRIGSYPSYKQAAAERDKVVSTASGAFVVVFDKNNKQIKVSDDMKK